jgi:dihydroxy-acid dehydratase
MLYRNMLAMDVEELLRAHPVDGAVLMGGCDKTTPALLMGATSAGLPAIYLPAGPMLRGNWKGKPLGSGSDAWKYWDERRAGNISDRDWFEMEAGIARSYGHCMTLGTASTMTAMAEAIGMTLPGASSIPAADANHIRMATECGRRAVEMVWEDLTPARIQTREAFENALAVAMAMGCSTNAIIHLIAQARRAGVALSLDDFETVSRKVPVVANIRPSGDTYLMEDFYYAGGLRAMMAEIRTHLHLDALTVNGRTLGENIADAKVTNTDVIRPLDNAVYGEGALAVLKGNLAPDGCVMKPSACDPRFL